MIPIYIISAMSASCFKDSLTFKPEDLNQIDLYNLVLVCRDWHNRYKKYLLDFKSWLQARTRVLNIFIKINRQEESYYLEDIIFGKKDVVGSNPNKTAFEKEINYDDKFVSQSFGNIISKAKSLLGEHEICAGDLIIINCYERDMVIVSKLYYCDGVRFKQYFFNPCRYPPYFWYKRNIGLLAEFYPNGELTIVPNEYLTYSMKFKTSENIGRWTGYNPKEAEEEPEIYMILSGNTNCKLIVDEFERLKQHMEALSAK
jgi:hypothetical protein